MFEFIKKFFSKVVNERKLIDQRNQINKMASMPIETTCAFESVAALRSRKPMSGRIDEDGNIIIRDAEQ